MNKLDSPPESDSGSTVDPLLRTPDSDPGQRASWIGKITSFLLKGIPSIIVLAMLVGLALWGRHHGWKLPKFSEITNAANESEDPWCDEHGVPEAECIACNAELMPKGELFGWCAVHGVHECVLDHPQLGQLKQIPVIGQEELDRANRAIAARPRTKNDPSCKMHLRRIQFPSIEAVNQAGIDIGLVDRGPIVETIKTTGEIVYDPTLIAKVSSKAGGTVFSVNCRLGDIVKTGDVLALIDAADVGRAKSQLLDSLVQFDLTRTTSERLQGIGNDAIPGSKIQQARADHVAAEVAVRKAIGALSNFGLPISANAVFDRPISEIREELQFLGLPEAIRQTIASTQTTSNLIPVVAPRDGIIVIRDVVNGEVVNAGNLLFTVADTRQMWLKLRAPLEEVSRMAAGQRILFQPDGSDEQLEGEVTWISTDVDRETRMVEVRGQIANEDGRLRNETFGAGEVVLREETGAIVVPNEAIHWEGCCNIAFVRDKDYFKEGSWKVFHTRSVRPGAIIGDKTEIIAGLLPGEVVVTKGSGILRAELLKGNLGAG